MVREPDNWKEVYELIASYRSLHQAPVDTEGSACLFDPAASPKDQRFQHFVALFLSPRTRDACCAAVMRRLLAMPGGLTLEGLLEVPEERLAEEIAQVGMAKQKAKRLKESCTIIYNEDQGDVPSTYSGLVRLPGVGPKIAHLALQLCWGKSEGVSADIHVHRISNRLGWANSKTPEKTSEQLTEWVPPSLYAATNPLLVGFGQLICRPRNPLCDQCPVGLAGLCPSAGKETIHAKKGKDVEDVV